MGVPSTILRASTSLRLGERVVVRCVDGALGAEYALFDPGEIVLRASDPVTVREMGYITTAGQARLRLVRMGITPELAQHVAGALSPAVVASYARAAVVRSLSNRLGAQELFDGAIYRAAHQTYEGAWLRLPQLTAATGERAHEVALTLQALHLAMVMSEVADNTTLQLSTANITRSGRSSERTYRRLSFDRANELPEILRALPPNPLAVEIDSQSEGAFRVALLARVRERVSPDAAPQLRAHLATMEEALALGTTAATPLDSPELRAIEQQLAAGDPSGIDERLEVLERLHGPLPAIRYLRARTSFVRGDEPPHKIAQVLSAIADEASHFHEAELVAARAWLAAGEDAHARYFAHRLVDDATAGESARLVALEILEETSRTARSNAPPPASVKPSAEHEIEQTAAAPFDPSRALNDAPPGASLPPVAPAVASPYSALAHAAEQSLPPVAVAPKSDPPVRHDAELVESLSLPPGMMEEQLGQGDTPASPAQARVAMTRLARTLGRDYRLWYGMTLRCNLVALDIVQRHLAQRYAGASLADARTTSELLRHGALLSEIIARALGGEWVDVGPTECGYWAMQLPNAMRCFPIGRVYRFVALGPRDRDLVAYYLDLEKRSRDRAP